MRSFFENYKNFNMSLNFSSRNRKEKLVVGRVFESISHRNLLLEESNEHINLFYNEYFNFIPFSNISDLLAIKELFMNDQKLFNLIIDNNIKLNKKYYNSNVFWKRLKRFFAKY